MGPQKQDDHIEDMLFIIGILRGGHANFTWAMGPPVP